MTARWVKLRHAWGNGGRWKILVGVLIASAVFAAGVGVLAWTRPAPFAPLSYPTMAQDVLGENELVTAGGVSISVPVVDYDGTTPPAITVTGSKCNNSGRPVDITAQRTWRSIEPPGSLVPYPSMVATLLPGCFTRGEKNPYLNVLPPELLERAAFLSRVSGNKVTLWQLQGIDTPRAPDGSDGITATWQTETFAVRVR